MKYEFHVGDYVETKNGTIGFISDTSVDNLPRWTVTKVSDADAVQSVYTVGFDYTITIVFSQINEFKRIGQYDFKKKDEGKEGKIKPLIIGRSVLTFMNNQGDNINIGHIVDKIDELVEAVNELREKND